MVAHVLGLRLALLAGALRGGPRHVVRVLLAFAAVVAATIVGCWGLTHLADAPAGALSTVVVVGGFCLTLGFLLAGALTGAEDPLDPRRFLVFGLPAPALLGTLALAGLLSIPVAAVAALATTAAVVSAERGAAVPAVVLGAVLGVLTCALAARAGFAAMAVVAPRRRRTIARGAAALALLVAVVPASVALVFLTGWGGRGLRRALVDLGEVLGAAPGGAGWAVIATGEGAAEPASWVFGILTPLVLGAVFAGLALRLLRHTPTTAPRDRGRLGWFLLMPGTPGGAIAARSMLYWLHDRRYLTNVAIVPVAAAVVLVPLLVAGMPLGYAILLPAPLVALFLGWLPHDDVAYDSTAVWMHVAAGVPGVSDRVGRLAPLLLLATPMLALAVPAAVAVNGDWTLLPALAGVCASLFFAGLGLSSISSVLAPYAVSRPGDSPFRQPQRTGSSGVIAQAAVMLGAIAASLPALWFMWLTLTRDDEYALSALWAGLATGGIVLVVGVAIGSAMFRRRGGRLLEFAETA